MTGNGFGPRCSLSCGTGCMGRDPSHREWSADDDAHFRRSVRFHSAANVVDEDVAARDLWRPPPVPTGAPWSTPRPPRPAPQRRAVRMRERGRR